MLAPSRIQIEGSLSNFDTSGGGIGGGTTFFELTRGGSVIYRSSIQTDEPDAALAFDEVVPAGIYRVVAHADGYIWVESSFDFLLAASPTNLVPALSPVTLGALLMGLFTVGGFALRRRAA
ncbi:MAG: hypothetical protein AB8G23_16260 [Myxococcota bacterium]